MDENDLLSRISQLVEEEHTLRETTDHTEEQRARFTHDLALRSERAITRARRCPTH